MVAVSDAVYVPALDPASRLSVYVPALAVSVMVAGAALVTLLELDVVPVPGVRVHVPPVTERVVVGGEPVFPPRVNVTVVEVPVV